jgi:hypothetical protein
MYVVPNERKKGIASAILKELETWSKELNFCSGILETGKKLPEAMKFYEKNNYSKISNYGQYEKVESSVCYKKYLTNNDKLICILRFDFHESNIFWTNSLSVLIFFSDIWDASCWDSFLE